MNRSPKRSSEFWIRSMLQRSEPIPMIMTRPQSSPERGGGPRAAGAWWWGCTGVRANPSTSLWLVPLPVPGRIEGDASSPRLVHERAHFCDARIEAGEDRLADQEMPDVEFGDLRNGGDGDDIVEGETVAGMGLDPVLGGERGGIGEAAEFFHTGLAVAVGVAAGVEFDHRRAEP